eukprot:jgi/Mesvir1/22384/Mv17876-RA.1
MAASRYRILMPCAAFPLIISLACLLIRTASGESEATLAPRRSQPVEPEFLIGVGMAKCGSGSLYHLMIDHLPWLLPPRTKELNFFNKKMYGVDGDAVKHGVLSSRDRLAWYQEYLADGWGPARSHARAHYYTTNAPISAALNTSAGNAAAAARVLPYLPGRPARQRHLRHRHHYGAASYLRDLQSPWNMRAVLPPSPRVRLVVILREPAARAHSAYFELGNTDASAFAAFVEAEARVLRACYPRVALSPTIAHALTACAIAHALTAGDGNSTSYSDRRSIPGDSVAEAASQGKTFAASDADTSMPRPAGEGDGTPAKGTRTITTTSTRPEPPLGSRSSPRPASNFFINEKQVDIDAAGSLARLGTVPSPEECGSWDGAERLRLLAECAEEFEHAGARAGAGVRQGAHGRGRGVGRGTVRGVPRWAAQGAAAGGVGVGDGDEDGDERMVKKGKEEQGVEGVLAVQTDGEAPRVGGGEEGQVQTEGDVEGDEDVKGGGGAERKLLNRPSHHEFSHDDYNGDNGYRPFYRWLAMLNEPATYGGEYYPEAQAAFAPYAGVLAHGLYGEMLRNVVCAGFKPSQVLVATTGELARDPQGLVRRIAEFAGRGADVSVDASTTSRCGRQGGGTGLAHEPGGKKGKPFYHLNHRARGEVPPETQKLMDDLFRLPNQDTLELLLNNGFHVNPHFLREEFGGRVD